MTALNQMRPAFDLTAFTGPFRKGTRSNAQEGAVTHIVIERFGSSLAAKGYNAGPFEQDISVLASRCSLPILGALESHATALQHLGADIKVICQTPATGRDRKRLQKLATSMAVRTLDFTRCGGIGDVATFGMLCQWLPSVRPDFLPIRENVFAETLNEGSHDRSTLALSHATFTGFWSCAEPFPQI